MPIKRACGYTQCPVEAALDLIGGKWKAMIVGQLLEGTLRFGELRRRLRGVTHRVLSLQLDDLERSGLIQRHVFADAPGRVEYALTASGHALGPVIDALRTFGSAYAMELRAARAQRGLARPACERDALTSKPAAPRQAW